LFAAERKRATWTRRCEEKLPKALSRLSYQVKDSEKFGLGLELNVLRARTERDIDKAFATLIPLRVGGLVIVNDVFLIAREEQLAALALRHKLPTIFQSRESVVAGGLMSYAGSTSDVYRQAGVYTGRILKGANPADLPVVQATKFELVINLQTARLLGITVPPTLLARADEVIE
jgi:ABC-type uncharacterized transport system substrate-binding protein